MAQIIKPQQTARASNSQRMLYPDVIRGRIAEMGLSEGRVAETIGLTSAKFSRVLTGHRCFSIHEALRLSQAIDLSFAVVLSTIEGGIWFANEMGKLGPQFVRSAK